MKSIKSKIQVSMLSVVLVGSVLIGVITALLNATGIDEVMTKTLGPATQMAANAVEWRMGNYWTALQEAAASDIFRDSDPMDQALVSVRDEIAQRNGFLYTGKMDANGFSSTGYSYAEEDYFQQCKATMQPYISDIMNDGQQMIFLLEVPIITNGRFDGIVYGGISADFLSDIVVDLAMGRDGVAYVLDHRGNVIGHRDASIVESGSNMIEAAKTDSSVADVAAVNDDSALESVVKHETAMKLIFIAAVYPPIVSSPKPFMTDCTQSCPTDTKDCWNMLGTATMAMVLKSPRSNAFTRLPSSAFIFRIRNARQTREITAATA